MAGETRKLNENPAVTSTANPEIKAIDLGMPRPWRIALRLVQLQLELIIDLEGSMLVGRAHPDSNFYPDIDLGAYGGADQGISREHLYIKLDGDRVVVIDNNSVNGTKLNGQALRPYEAYPLRHGDELELGLMRVQVELLINPYE